MTEEFGKRLGPNGDIAFRQIFGEGPTVVWLGGFKSDMTGTKAEALAEWASRSGRAFLRFDYSGHGASDGEFEDGTITAWLSDALFAIDTLTNGPLILVGSSMGAWIAALAAIRHQERLAGVVFIAPAPDFTEILMWETMSESEKTRLLQTGRLVEASQYSDEPTIITLALIEDGRRHLLLGGPVEIECPVRILQGMVDPDVPWRHAVKFAELIRSDDLELTLIKSGDHRLSKPHELAKLVAAVASV